MRWGYFFKVFQGVVTCTITSKCYAQLQTQKNYDIIPNEKGILTFLKCSKVSKCYAQLQTQKHYDGIPNEMGILF